MSYMLARTAANFQDKTSARKNPFQQGKDRPLVAFGGLNEPAAVTELLSIGLQHGDVSSVPTPRTDEYARCPAVVDARANNETNVPSPLKLEKTTVLEQYS